MSLLVLLDLSVAFDTIDNDILLGRISRLGIGGLSLSWVLSFLKDHPQRVQLNEMVSTPWSLNCGFPQGLILSPILFNYTRPLGEVIRSYIQFPLSFHPSVEDAVLSFEHCLNAVLGWMRVNRLNPGKTEVLRLGTPSIYVLEKFFPFW